MQETAAHGVGGTRVLVVDDDPTARQFVNLALGFSSMAVDEASDGPEALDLLDRHRYDAVVCDVVLPSVSGMTLLREIKAKADVAVVMLSACDDSAFSVIALEAGADDYCTKPLNERELVLRVERALEHRRARPTPATQAAGVAAVVAHESLVIDPLSRIAVLDGVELDLTLKEFDLLLTLASNPGQVFTRGDLLESVWETKPDWQSVDTVTEHVYRLRQKLSATPAAGDWIQTVRGAGYRFAATRTGDVTRSRPRLACG